MSGDWRTTALFLVCCPGTQRFQPLGGTLLLLHKGKSQLCFQQYKYQCWWRESLMQVLLASTVLRENSQRVLVLICVCALCPSAVSCLCFFFLNSAVHPKMVLPFFAGQWQTFVQDERWLCGSLWYQDSSLPTCIFTLLCQVRTSGKGCSEYSPSLVPDLVVAVLQQFYFLPWERRTVCLLEFCLVYSSTASFFSILALH